MRCSACNTHNSDSNRFCESCGKQFGAICSSCGRENTPNARFCGGCGTSIAAAAPPSVEAWVTPPARDAAATHPAQPRGELKIATVLFADIASSTEAVANLGPEEAMQRLLPAVQEMCDAVERYGGTVVRTLGDGIMALFGAPRTLEGHVRLACEAALRIQASFAETGDLRVRIGLHTGQIASDPTVGFSARSDAVHGLTIHLASRVMASAEPGEIRITQASGDQVGTYYDLRPLKAVPLRGISEPTELFTLARRKLGPEATPAKSTRARFRGRTEELRLLQLAATRAEVGDGLVIDVSGEPGSGKSRLCSEFVQWSRTLGMAVHEFQAQFYGHAAPLQPVLELFRRCFFNISDLDDVAGARLKITQQLAAHASDGGLVPDPGDAALLADFIGLVNAAEVPQRSVSAARQARLLALMRHFVRQPRDKAMLIVLEDLHWIDSPSLEFLSELVSAVPGTRILLLLNYRPSFAAPWRSLPHCERVELGELGDDVIGQIVEDLSNLTHDFSAARDLIVRRSQGNPLYATELVRSLSEEIFNSAQSSLARQIGAMESSLPISVQSIIGARIDRLNDADKSLLQLCSVFGQEIPLKVLERVATENVPAQLVDSLDRLCASDFFQQHSGDAGVEYSFLHPLIREVAYETQLRARRALLHRAVAAAMEDHYRARGKAFSALIAYHYAESGERLKAAEHEADAARWIASTNAPEAIKHWRKVRDLLKDEMPEKDAASLRSLAGAQIVLLGWREGLRQEEIQQIVEETLALAEPTDVSLVQLLLFAQGRSLQSNGGASDEYVRCVKKALALAPDAISKGRKALLNIALSHACAWSGLLEEGIAANDAGLAHQAEIDDFDREFIGVDINQWAYGIRARLLNRLGRFDEALQHLDQISTRAAAIDDPVMKQIAHHIYVDLAWCTDNKDLVADHSAHVSKFALTSNSSYAQVFAHNSAGLAASVLGDFSTARASFNEAMVRLKESRAALEFGPEILAGLAECCLAEDAIDDAVSYSESAIDAARLQSNRIAECRSRIVLGLALLRREECERVPSLLEQAKELVDATGASILKKKLAFASQECLNALGAIPTQSAAATHQ